MNTLLLLVVLGLIVLGADRLVDGASAIARRCLSQEWISRMLLAFAACYYYLFVKL